MKSRIVVLAHGWGLSLNGFNELIEEIQLADANWAADTLWLGVEQGYFADHPAGLYQFSTENRTWQPLSAGLDATQAIAELQMRVANKPTVFGIGHSLGFAKLLTLPFQWNGLVSLHGFTRFCRLTDNQQGTAPKVLKLMVRQFSLQPRKVLHDFLSKAGHPEPEKVGENIPLDIDKLQTDLHSMLNIDEVVPEAISSLWLATKADCIVPFNLSTELAADSSGNLQEAGSHHLGPLFEPSLYTERLFEFVNQCAAKTSRIP